MGKRYRVYRHRLLGEWAGMDTEEGQVVGIAADRKDAEKAAEELNREEE